MLLDTERALEETALDRLKDGGEFVTVRSVDLLAAMDRLNKQSTIVNNIQTWADNMQEVRQ